MGEAHGGENPSSDPRKGGFFGRVSRLTLPLRVALYISGSTLLTATVLAIGFASFTSSEESIRQLSRILGTEISRQSTFEMEANLAPAPRILLDFTEQAGDGNLPVGDTGKLGIELLDRLRTEPEVTWVCFVDAAGAMTGAFRRGDGHLELVRSQLADGLRASRTVERHTTGDHLDLISSGERPGEDPRGLPIYDATLKEPHLFWTGLFNWGEIQGFGLAACIKLRGATGETLGTLSAGFEVDSLSEVLKVQRRGVSGQVAILDKKGNVIATSTQNEGRMQEVDPVLTDIITYLGPSVDGAQRGKPVMGRHVFDRTRYVYSIGALSVDGGFDAVVAMYAPYSELFGFVDSNFYWTLGIGLGAVAVLVFLINHFTGIIASPLRVLADDLLEVAKFRFSRKEHPRSNIREIEDVGDATSKMKASLRSFGRYVPGDIVRDLLCQGAEAKLGMEPRKLTLFLSDLEGFTPLCEMLSPDEVVTFMEGYLAMIVSAIEGESGTIDKFIGDGVLAFFNAPQPLPDHAAAACRAVLKIQQEEIAFAARWKGRLGRTVRTRIGLHTDTVLVGNIGTPERFSYTVMGDGVNLTSRLESSNKLYATSLLASRETRDAGGDAFEWRRIDRVVVKGRTRSEEIYELLGVKGDVPRDRLQLRDDYEAALAHYFAGRFAEAATSFEGISARWPTDGASAYLLGRCREKAGPRTLDPSGPVV